MGRRGVIGDGKGAATVARSFVWFSAGGLRGGLFARGVLLFPVVSSVGLAANVCHRRATGLAGYFRALPGERIRGVAKNAARELARTGARDCIELETIPLSHRADDDDEFCFARYSRHVSDFSEGAARILSPASRDDCSHLQHRRFDWRD